MDVEAAKKVLVETDLEIKEWRRNENSTNFPSLRSVDAKIREVRTVFAQLGDITKTLYDEMGQDNDFSANSRRVRLEALEGYISSALRFLEFGGQGEKKKIIAPPDFSPIIGNMHGLQESLERRWREAQKCIHFGAYLSAVIMMGSVLEGLLLAKAQNHPETAYRSQKAPKGKDGRVARVQDWNLNNLIEVAIDSGWIKTDRGKFSHALRESRNIVHPWAEVTRKAHFDDNTCEVCWQVLRASTKDLLQQR